jgi:ubiquinone/menaquinone biosynthesis C-methylase UbiE
MSRRTKPLLEKIPIKNSYIPTIFDNLALEYDNWFEQEGAHIFAIEVRAFEEVLDSLPKPWLEIGVGSGRFAKALGIEIGIDPSAKLLELAIKRGIKVIQGKGEQHLFRPGSFASVFLIVTLCFVDSPSEVLKETYRVLAPRGKLVLGLVLKDSPWGQFYEEMKKQGHRFYKHATFYKYDEVSTILEEAGFSITNVVSTLFQKPGKVEHMELPQKGLLPDAGFVIIIASKHNQHRDVFK